MNAYQRLRMPLQRHSGGRLYRSALCFANSLFFLRVVSASAGGHRISPPPALSGGRSISSGLSAKAHACMSGLVYVRCILCTWIAGSLGYGLVHRYLGR
jgi:hypothetical protein